MTEQTSQTPLTMEQKIHECRRVLQDDLINKESFERRYRPNLERMQSSCLVWGDEMCALRRFQHNDGKSARVWELVEFLIGGKTDLCLVINFQTKQILEYSRYLDGEVTMVDQIQEAKIYLGEK